MNAPILAKAFAALDEPTRRRLIAGRLRAGHVRHGLDALSAIISLCRAGDVNEDVGLPGFALRDLGCLLTLVSGEIERSIDEVIEIADQEHQPDTAEGAQGDS